MRPVRKPSRKNCTIHGLAGKFKAQAEHELAEYKRLFEHLANEYNANTHAEVEFIGKMVAALIRSERALHLQHDCLAFLDCDPEDDQLPKDLELYLRYQASHDRACQRYAAELSKLQSEKKKAAIGFESQKRQEAKEQRAQAQETRRANNENRRQEQHEIKILNDKARLEHQQMVNRKPPSKFRKPKGRKTALPANFWSPDQLQSRTPKQ